MHRGEDMLDADLRMCQNCDRYFRQDSFRGNVCRVCFDRVNLQHEANWIKLNEKSIQQFSFSDIISKTLTVSDMRNLPPTLRRYGRSTCVLDYSLPEAYQEEKEKAEELLAQEEYHDHNLHAGNEHEDKVALSVFLESNRNLIDTQTDKIRGFLQDAAKKSNTRSLLIYDEKRRVEVYADKRVILSENGEEHLKLMNRAWRQYFGISLPILFTMLAVLYFANALTRQENMISNPGHSSYALRPGPAATLPITTVLIAGGVLVGAIFATVILMVRFREFCINCFKKFIVLDLFFSYAAGGGILLLILVQDVGFRMDAITFFVFIWNFAVLGCVSLYLPVSPFVHRLFLVSLNVIMATMLAVTFEPWIIICVLLTIAIADVVASLRPNQARITPFILPTSFQLLYETPRVFYHAGNLRIRTLDMMLYGLMAALANYYLGSVVSALCAIMAGLTMMVFVAPFVGKRFRPLPVALAFLFCIVSLQNTALEPFVLTVVT